MKSRFLGIFIFFILSVIFIAGFYLNATSTEEAKAHPSPSEESHVDERMFEAIFERIKEDYVEPVTDEKLLEGALTGMLSALDPHSTYLPPKEYNELKENTKGVQFGGLGLEVVMENGLVKIIAPIDDTPAHKAGLQSGDLIVGINKKPIIGMTLLDAVELMRGKPGTKVRLHIKREGQDVFETVLTRATIEPKAVKWRKEGNVGYIRITTFTDEKTTKLVKDAALDLKKQLGNKLEGIVIDVRNNPGGLLDTAIGVSNLFLKKGQEIVSIKGRNPELDTHIQADNQDILTDTPIVVLINGGTASSSEIVAGALRDNHRAIIVGTKSFGKGSVQAVLPLTNAGALKLTIARYYTPAGVSIQAKGIEPDIPVEQAIAKLEKIDEKDRIHEGDIKGALDTKNSKETKNLGEDELETTAGSLASVKKEKEKEIEDYQLMRALDIVRTIFLTKKFSLKGEACQ